MDLALQGPILATSFCYNAVAYGEIITVTRQNQLDIGDNGVAPNFTLAPVPCTK